MEFEINFLVLQAHTENLETIREKVKKLIEAQNGKVTETLEYRKRKLAYKIKHEQYGFFTVFRFTLEDNDAIVALRKDLNLNHEVARYLIVRASELPSLKEEVAPAQQEKNQMEQKDTIKQEDIEKILSGKKVQKKTETVQQPQPVTPQEQKEEITAQEPAEEEKAADEKKPTQEEKKEVEVDKDGKSSLEDLDKKLDEILNI